jgi:hypothetical protein
VTSLYQRLFTYRERHDRSPLEDFLSEALADLLNRLPDAIARDAVAQLLRRRPDAVADLERLWPQGVAGRWVTQRVIDDGRRIDLLFEVAGTPLLLVENKIGAGFQQHRVEDPDGRKSQHQLATYGRWLQHATTPDWGGALVLLTHWTPAPIDFVASKAVYGCRFRSVLRWADVSRWLSSVVRHNAMKDAAWAQLAAELVAFLKDQSMDSEIATSHDLAALQVYVASADRVRNSIEAVWEGARATWRPICQQTEYPLSISTAYGCIWKYRYLARKDLRLSYIAAGIRYPEASDDPAYADPNGEPHLFVEISSDDESPSINDLKLPTPWAGSDNLWLAKVPLRDLPTPADHFLFEAEKWVAARIVEAAKVLA